MKRKTVLQLWGRYDTGKTGTIKIIKEELEKKYINVHHSYSFPLPEGEVFSIFQCNGYLIGISSMGDFLNLALENHLKECFKKCSIIIAASRIRNEVSAFIEKSAIENDFRLIKVTNYRLEGSKRERFDFNQAAAVHIVDLVDQLMSGKL